eukprot:gnl/TRDRNA2_/TRDRNA2_31133_c0_seq1.p1 gnl/TRDRNA2_/TRDRNA2_31133_c0~~gnl/TRDRNA2_/TRDRNA2_31133_c0_seq1.p1  ORF type:complete len:144 (-),score=18.97 gnl/TRDRNA2_/TRDRNA2_31133_c0_seq1:33-464(-)
MFVGIQGFVMIGFILCTLFFGSNSQENESTDPRGICELPPATGMCKAAFRRYHFDPSTEDCQEFIYGGCGGNANNFETVDECEAVCTVEKETRSTVEEDLIVDADNDNNSTSSCSMHSLGVVVPLLLIAPLGVFADASAVTGV